MHNLSAIFAQYIDICKQFAGNLVNEQGNVPRYSVVPRFSDLEVVALNMASESIGIDSESLLFVKLQEYKSEIDDIVFIYCSQPESRIRFKMKVIKTDISYKDSIKEEKSYWGFKGNWSFI